MALPLARPALRWALLHHTCARYPFVTEKIEDYNSAFYYDAPQNILNAYLYNEIE